MTNQTDPTDEVVYLRINRLTAITDHMGDTTKQVLRHINRMSDERFSVLLGLYSAIHDVAQLERPKGLEEAESHIESAFSHLARAAGEEVPK